MNSKIFKGHFKREFFGFAKVVIEVPDEIYDTFREIAPLLFKRYLIVIYLSKGKCIKKKTDRKTTKKVKKSY